MLHGAEAAVSQSVKYISHTAGLLPCVLQAAGKHEPEFTLEFNIDKIYEYNCTELQSHTIRRRWQENFFSVETRRSAVHRFCPGFHAANGTLRGISSSQRSRSTADCCRQRIISSFRHHRSAAVHRRRRIISSSRHHRSAADRCRRRGVFPCFRRADA